MKQGPHHGEWTVPQGWDHTEGTGPPQGPVTPQRLTHVQNEMETSQGLCFI